jgi:hypothetical protein
MRQDESKLKLSLKAKTCDLSSFATKMNSDAIWSRLAAVQDDAIAVLALSVHGALLLSFVLGGVVKSSSTTTKATSLPFRLLRRLWLLVSILLAMRAAYLVMKRFEFFMQSRVVLGFNEEDAELLRRSSLYYHVGVCIVIAANLVTCVCCRVRFFAELCAGAMYSSAVLAWLESMYLFSQVVEVTLHEIYLLTPLTLFVAVTSVKLLISFICTTTTTTNLADTDTLNKKKRD